MSLTLRGAASVFLGMPPFMAVLRRTPLVRHRPRIEPSLRAATAATPTPRAGVNVEKMLAATRRAPELAPIEWSGDADARVVALPPQASEPPLAAADPPALDARCRKIRERYIGARFPGMIRTAADLHEHESVIKAARLFFEDGETDLAFELLELAIEESASCEPVHLARLEMLFLMRAAARYVEAARAFRAAHPASEAWPEVKRLGHALAPSEALFGIAGQPREHEHYGPWPHLPNWIQASWDLTAEVSAVDFHRALARAAATSPQSAA